MQRNYINFSIFKSGGEALSDLFSFEENRWNNAYAASQLFFAKIVAASLDWIYVK